MNRQPTHEDIINIVDRMYEKDGISRKEVVHVVDTFPNQGNNLKLTILSCHYFCPLAWFIKLVSL